MSFDAAAPRRLLRGRLRRLIRGRRRRRVRVPPTWIRPQRIRLAIALVLLSGLVLGGGWFLLRDSPLVSVDHVTVTGVHGGDAAAIRSALRSAARKMTTLDVQPGQLRAAVSRFPEVKGLRVSTQFPDGLVIRVVELLAVAEVEVGGRKVPVTGKGRLLPAREATGPLPMIPLSESPSGGRLTQAWALAAARLLEAAPYQVLSRVTEVTTVAGHGLVGQLRAGPSIYFGDATQAAAKWAAVLAVLANSRSDGASYIDVTNPEHPAAGTTAALGTGTGAGSTAGTAGAGSTAGTAGAGSTAGATGAGSTAGTAGAGSTPGTTGAGSTPGTTGTAAAGGTSGPATTTAATGPGAGTGTPLPDTGGTSSSPAPSGG